MARGQRNAGEIDAGRAHPMPSIWRRRRRLARLEMEMGDADGVMRRARATRHTAHEYGVRYLGKWGWEMACTD